MPRLDLLTDRFPDPAGNEFADSIPVAPSAGVWKFTGRRASKRNRAWERAHRPYRYVNVSIELREEVLALANHLDVTADEVARALFEYELECLDEGLLQLRTRPNPQGGKMTLFPHDQAKGWEKGDGSPSEIPARRRKPSAKRREPYPAVSYRLPESVHNSLCGLAMELDVPVGQVVAFFLQDGLAAYRRGKLCLNPEPRSVKMTLHGERT